MENNTEAVHGIFRELGADLCGVAGAERFSDAPAGFAPSDLFAPFRSAVVFAVALPAGLAEVSPRMIYAHFNAKSAEYADRIAFRGAKALERALSCRAVPVPSDGPYDSWDPATLTGHGLLSVKHAAVAAGLGVLGRNSLLLTPEYGNFVTVGVVLTDAALPSDPLCPPLCLPGCGLCERSCPVGAIREGRVDQSLCRPNTYGTNARGFDTVNCNRCRSVCPLRLGTRRGE